MNATQKYYSLRYFCLAGTILFGSGSIIITKRLDIIGFYYPLFQTGLMFFGELICGLFSVVNWPKKKINTNTKCNNLSSVLSDTSILPLKTSAMEKYGKLGFCIAGLFDLMGSFLEYFSFDLLQASAIVTFKMMVIVFIWVYRVCVLKKKVFRHQWLGLGLLLVGFLIVGFEVAFYSQQKIIWSTEAGLGIGLMILAQFFNALNFIIEEYLMQKVQINVPQILAIEGLTGLVTLILLYLPFHYLSHFQAHNNFEISAPVNDIINSEEVFVLSVSIVAVIGLLNYFLVKTIKISDSLALCTIDSGRVILVWILAIAFNFESVLPVEITGGLSLVLGILIYNEVLIIPCCGFKKATKISMRESQVYQQFKNKDRTWQNNLDRIV